MDKRKEILQKVLNFGYELGKNDSQIDFPNSPHMAEFLAELDKLELSTEEIATRMTQVSEEKYHGKAFTFNYMIDVIAKALTTARDKKREKR